LPFLENATILANNVEKSQNNGTLMAKKTAALLPATDALLRQFGERLRSARLRRRLTAKQVAERAGMAVMTLRSVERGESGVTIGAYLSVMQVLGMEHDLSLLAKDDPLGRSLQDAKLPQRRAPALGSYIRSGAAALRPERDLDNPSIEGSAAYLKRLAGDSPAAQIKNAINNLPLERTKQATEQLPSEQIGKAVDAPPSQQVKTAVKENQRQTLRTSKDLAGLLKAPGIKKKDC
jgi:transcriptional regulator with XRE-family HTH domain